MTIASLKKFAAIYAIAAESFYTGVGLLMLTLDGHRYLQECFNQDQSNVIA
jgi:hypothetical protein